MGAGGGEEVVLIPCGGGAGLLSPLRSSSLPPFTSGMIPGDIGGGLDGTLGARLSSSTSIGGRASPGASMAERLRSRSSGGRLRGCVSAAKIGREEFWVREVFRTERGCLSRVDLVGDREDDFLVGERGERSGAFGLDLESPSDFFLGEDLEKKAGRTMEMMMAPGNTGLV